MRIRCFWVFRFCQFGVICFFYKENQNKNNLTKNQTCKPKSDQGERESQETQIR